jgi:hypothetical protein
VADATGYAARLLAYTEGKDPLAIQQEMPAILAGLIREVPQAKLAKSPSPGKWSVGEILAHLAEDELTSSWRYRQMLEHDGVSLTGFDQDLWAKLGNYSAWDRTSHWRCFVCCARPTYECCERFRRSNGSAAAYMPSVAR